MDVRTIPVGQFRANLAEVLSAVEQGGRVLLTRHEKVIAVLVPPNMEAPSALEMAAAELLADVTRSSDTADLPPVITNPEVDPAQWVEQLLAERR